MVSEIEQFECTTAKLLIRKRYYVYVLFLIPVFIVQVTESWYSLQYNKCSKIPPSTSVLDDRMRGQNYLDFLQNELPKQLEYVSLATEIANYFQHDGATCIIPDV